MDTRGQSHSPLPHDIETELCIGMILLGSEPEPFHGFGIVFRNAIAPGVHVTQAVLGIDIPLLGGASIPFHGFGLVFHRTRAGFLHDPEAVLGLTPIMSSSNQRPANKGFRSVLRCAITPYRQSSCLSAPQPPRMK